MGSTASVQAVVFDLDGVLIDSEPVWERVRRSYVAEHGGTWTDDAQQRLMGMSTPEWAAYLSGELGVNEDPDDVQQAVIAEMADSYERNLPLLPGADAAVRRLASAWRLGLASSSPRRLIDRVLELTGWAALFQATRSTEEVARGKPAPDVYEAVARDLRREPSACAAIEDSSNGILSAAAAGLRVVAIPRPEYPPSERARSAAVLTLDDLEALTPQVLQSL
jgi:HAD superfamily hydrolase (TIGR01509 family)